MQRITSNLIDQSVSTTLTKSAKFLSNVAISFVCGLYKSCISLLSLTFGDHTSFFNHNTLNQPAYTNI